MHFIEKIFISLCLGLIILILSILMVVNNYENYYSLYFIFGWILFFISLMAIFTYPLIKAINVLERC